MKGSSFFRNILQINRWYTKPCVKYWHSAARWMKAGGQVLVTCSWHDVPHGTQAQTWHDGREVRPGSRPVFQGRCRGAETSLETGLAHDATEPEPHCPLAMDAAMQGQYLRAGQQCAEALRLAPDFPSVHVELAEILAAQRKAAGAISGYRRALKLQPDLPDA